MILSEPPSAAISLGYTEAGVRTLADQRRARRLTSVPYLTCPNCRVTNYVVPSYLARRERCIACDRQLDERAAAILPPPAAIVCDPGPAGETPGLGHEPSSALASIASPTRPSPAGRMPASRSARAARATTRAR